MMLLWLVGGLAGMSSRSLVGGLGSFGMGIRRGIRNIFKFRAELFNV